MRVIDQTSSNSSSGLQVYEAKTVKAVSHCRKKQLQALKDQITELKKQFTVMASMSDFQGEGAEAIKNFYKAHATIADHWILFLEARIAFLDQIGDDQEEKDLGGDTVVVMPFLTDELRSANNRSLDLVDQQQNDLEGIFSSISDILPLHVFSKEMFTTHMDDAREGMNKTLVVTEELDQQLIGEYGASGAEMQNIIQLMNGLIEATRSGNDISPIHFNSSDFLNSEAYRNRDDISDQTKEYVGFKKEQEAHRKVMKEIEELENRSIGEKIWDGTKTFTGEVTGYYDYIRAEEGIDPVTGEKLTTSQRIAAGGMAAAGFIPIVGWAGRGLKGAKAVNSTIKASNALDAYKGAKGMSYIGNAEKGIYGLIAANEIKGNLTGTDYLGNEVSTDQSGLASGLSIASIIGVGRLVRSQNVGIIYGGKGTGNTISDYLDDIIVNGKVYSAKMNKLKNAIQNNTFSVDELSVIRKKMSDLGITKEYDEVLIKMDFGKYLRGLIGDPPAAMKDPHAHHILFKKGLGEAQQKLVQEGQAILRKYGIDPVIGKENLVWAPNRVAGQHNIAALENVVKQLKAVDAAGADIDDIIEILEDLGKKAASRK